MKRFVFLVAALAAGTVALTSANAHTQATRSVCHRTSSATRPYVKLRVTAAQLRAHTNHPADIIPAPAGACPRTLLATNGGTAFTVTLTGEAESPAADPTGTGTATLRLRRGQGQLCYKLSAVNMGGAAVAAHVHKADAGASGPVVIPLATPANGTSGGCVGVARSLVAQILASPASFYVNVHTAAFPAGAIRGQLTGTSSAAAGMTFSLALKGTSEPNASGTAVVRVRKDAGMVCYRLHAENITLPATAAHIHKGAAGTNGPVVVGFNPPGSDGNSSGCSPAQAAIIDDILANPSGYYVNVHTKEHPAGAIRAQLA